jgi:cell migration-inducing and hyaluronan-binding protein
MPRQRSSVVLSVLVLGAALGACSTDAQPPTDGSAPPAPVGPAVDAVQSGVWSNPATWGGGAVKPGARLTIPSGVTVTLDASTPALDSLTVNGTLRFANTDLELTSGSIMVMGGTLEIGTEAVPFTQRATITLTGGESNTNEMGCGAKFVCAMNGGRLEWHGSSRDAVSWTKLGETAAAGDDTLKLVNAVRWRPGDEIVLAPSGFDPDEFERLTVKGVSTDGKTVTLETALAFAHWGALQNYTVAPGRTVTLDERAEVGLLTRNITVRSAADSVDAASFETSRRFGGHVMVMRGGVARIEGVTFKNMGQETRLGRYAFHWHLAGDVGGQYIKNSSVDTTFTRGIVVHGSNNALVEGNVVFNSHSHGYIFAEDGSESGNRFLNNLGIRAVQLPNARRIFRNDVNNPGDLTTRTQDEVRPSVFWGLNHNQTFQGNAAVGATAGSGFFFSGRMHYGRGEGPARPGMVDTLVFENNTAHSNDNAGDGGGNQFYSPTTDGCGLFVRNIAGALNFNGLTAYKNSSCGAWLESIGHTLSGSVIADNAAGVVTMNSPVSDTTIVGASDNGKTEAIPRAGDLFENKFNVSAGIFTTRQQGGDKVLELTGVRFVNMDTDPATKKRFVGILVNDPLVETESGVRGLKFINSSRPYLFTPGRDGNLLGGFIDADGSLSGASGARRVLGNDPAQVTGACTPVAGSAVLVSCPANHRLAKLNVDLAYPTYSKSRDIAVRVAGATATTGALASENENGDRTFVVPGREYVLEYAESTHAQVALDGETGDRVVLSLPFAANTLFVYAGVTKGEQRFTAPNLTAALTPASSLAALRAGVASGYFRSGARVYVKIVGGAKGLHLCASAECR